MTWRLCVALALVHGIEKFFFRGVIYGGVQGETMCVPVLGIRAWSSLDSTVNRWEPKGS